jgi:nitrate/nitrite transporter NarK
VAGLHGWQWLFIIEAVPALLLPFGVYFYLPGRPAEAHWLQPEERGWLCARLTAELRIREAAQEHVTTSRAVFRPRVLWLALVYFGVVACLYGMGFFLPQIVKDFGVTDLQTGFVAAIPYVVGAFALVYWGRRSDRTGERKLHTAFALFVMGAGMLAASFLSDPILKMAAFSFAAFGVFGCLRVFWTLPVAFLSGGAAAGGTAIINSLGNLSGFAGPYAIGAIKDWTGEYQGGLQVLAALGFVAMVVVLTLRRSPGLDREAAAARARGL